MKLCFSKSLAVSVFLSTWFSLSAFALEDSVLLKNLSEKNGRMFRIEQNKTIEIPKKTLFLVWQDGKIIDSIADQKEEASLTRKLSQSIEKARANIGLGPVCLLEIRPNDQYAKVHQIMEPSSILYKPWIKALPHEKTTETLDPSSKNYLFIQFLKSKTFSGILCEEDVTYGNFKRVFHQSFDIIPHIRKDKTVVRQDELSSDEDTTSSSEDDST